jgi:hypothetical protein
LTFVSSVCSYHFFTGTGSALFNLGSFSLSGLGGQAVGGNSQTNTTNAGFSASGNNGTALATGAGQATGGVFSGFGGSFSGSIFDQSNSSSYALTSGLGAFAQSIGEGGTLNSFFSQLLP